MFSLTCTWLRISLPNVLLQLKCVNSVGSWEDFSRAATWSGGGEEDGWNHFFKADLNLIITFNFPASLSEESLLALLVWRTRGGAELRSGPEGFWGGCKGRWGFDPHPPPRLRGGQPDSACTHRRRHAGTGCCAAAELGGEPANQTSQQAW